MPYKIEIKQDVTYHDVSDYVTEVSDIPFITRNDDFTLFTDNVTIKLSQAFNETPFNIDDTVLIWSASTLLFNGYIFEWHTEQETYENVYTVNNITEKLKEVDFNKANMATILDGNVDYITVMGNTTHNWKTEFISYVKLIQSLFATIGMDVEFLEHHIYENIDVYWPTPETFWDGTYLTYPLQMVNTSFISTDNLWFYKYQLYCVNQPKTYGYTQIDYLQDGTYTQDYIITCWDLLSELLALGWYVLVPKSETEFYATCNVTNVPVRSVNYETYEKTTVKRPQEETAQVYVYYSIPFYNDDSRAVVFQRNMLPFMRIPGEPIFEPDALYYDIIGGTDPGWSPPWQKPYYGGQGAHLDHDKKQLDWYDHLNAYCMYPNATYGYLPIIVYPDVFDNTLTLKYKLLSNKSYEIVSEYESPVNTERLASVVENYISLTDDSPRMSTIKLIEFSTEGPINPPLEEGAEVEELA